MSDNSHQTVKTLAGLIWFSGALVLALKGGSLLAQALEIRTGDAWSWLALPAGILVGSVKSEVIFGRACLKNLDRISSLERPKIWQAYRPAFYLFLTVMIVLGGSLSRLAAGNYAGLMAVAILDFSLATALIGGGRYFWRRS